MIKIIYCVRRRPDISKEAFDDYWSGPHAALVRQYAGTLKIQRYVQSPVTHHDINAMLATGRTPSVPFDGVAELYFASLDDMAAPQSSEAAAAAQGLLVADEAKFVDSVNSQMFVCTERQILP